MTKQIDADVLDVLARGRTDGPRYYLPAGQLDRKLYTRVDSILTLAGGKWMRGAKAHVFDQPADDALDTILLTGQIEDTKRDLQQFFTPPDVALLVMTMADIDEGMDVLEPSAGGGALAMAARDQGGRVECVEADPALAAGLRDMGFRTETADFLALAPGHSPGGGGPPLFDRIVMNPPFTRQQDEKHILHAYRFLRPGGKLIAIASAMAGKRANAQGQAFASFFDWPGRLVNIEILPAGAFKESGTMVKTIIFEIQG